jgi:hypothetical protein
MRRTGGILYRCNSEIFFYNVHLGPWWRRPETVHNLAGSVGHRVDLWHRKHFLESLCLATMFWSLLPAVQCVSSSVEPEHILFLFGLCSFPLAVMVVSNTAPGVFCIGRNASKWVFVIIAEAATSLTRITDRLVGGEEDGSVEEFQGPGGNIRSLYPVSIYDKISFLQ